MIKLKDLLNEEKPGLWANIRAKKARGEKNTQKIKSYHLMKLINCYELMLKLKVKIRHLIILNF